MEPSQSALLFFNAPTILKTYSSWNNFLKFWELSLSNNDSGESAFIRSSYSLSIIRIEKFNTETKPPAGSPHAPDLIIWSKIMTQEGTVRVYKNEQRNQEKEYISSVIPSSRI